MPYNLIASGSGGNCIIYKDNVMVDIGIKLKDRELIIPYLDNIKVIIITHRHSDHIQIPLMKWLIKEYPDITYMYIQDVRDYLDEKLVKKVKGETVQIEVPKEVIIEPLKVYNLGIMKFQPINVYHDVPNIALYAQFKDRYRLFHATDTHTLEGIKIPRDTDLIAVEHHHEIDHYDELIAEKALNDEFSHELGAKNVHMAFEVAEQFLIDNEIEDATVLRLHMSSDGYYDEIEVEYQYKFKEEENV